MSEIVLSKDTDKVLCLIYKEYLSRRKNNILKDSALHFSENDLDDLFPNSDINFEILELKNNSLIEVWITGEVLLNSNAIIYMENRFKNSLIELTDFISKFIP